MKKFIPVALALLLGLGIFFVVNKASNKSQPEKGTSQINNQAEPTPNDSKIEDISGTFKDLISRNATMQCSFEVANESGMTAGNIYVAGNKMRGDFTSKLEDGKEAKNYMIRDEEYAYTWNSLQPQGMKVKLSEVEKMQNSMQKNNQNSKDFASLDSQNFNYTCKPWSKDEGVFLPPSNIKFTDLTEQMEEVKDVTNDVKSTQCQACQNIPAGQGREQCLTSLGCN